MLATSSFSHETIRSSLGPSAPVRQHQPVLAQASLMHGRSRRRRNFSLPKAFATISHDSESMLEYTLQLARQNDFDNAAECFEAFLAMHPERCKAWVSYAQMEKRRAVFSNHPDRFSTCRELLQRGLTANPTSACLMQAWGLMELQRGNLFAAVSLIERCVRCDPSLAPVLRWLHVDNARETVSSRRRHQSGGSSSSNSLDVSTTATSLSC